MTHLLIKLTISKKKSWKGKKERQEKLENRGLLAIFVYVFSATLLLIAWGLFVVLTFVNILAKISAFKRKIKEGVKVNESYL